MSVEFKSKWSTTVFPLGTRGPDGPLAPIARRYISWLPRIVLFGLLASLLESGSIGLLIPLLSLVVDGQIPNGLPTFLHPAVGLLNTLREGQRVLAVAFAILLLISAKGMVQAANAARIAYVEGRISHDIRTALAERILSLNYPFFLKHDGTKLVNIIATDSWRAADVVRLIFSVIISISALCVFCVMLVLLQWKLFCFVVAGVVAIRAIQSLFLRKLRKLGQAVTEDNGALSQQMLLIINSIRLIRLFGQHDREHEAFREVSDRLRGSLLAVQKATASSMPRLEMMQSILFVAVLLVASEMAMSLPETTAFLVLLYRMQPRVTALDQARLGIAPLRASVEQVEWLLGQEDDPIPAAGGRPMPETHHDIYFKNVSYSYPTGSGAALSEASFTIPYGTSTALIGRSGAGKSTIVNLLCRLIEPETGALYLGNAAISEISAGAWRRHVAIAGQDIDLIDGTIAENIAYGRPEASLAEIEEAARIADADEFISRLPFGYDSRVGLRGLSLSGGQRQRIGLARALLVRPRLLILDEATNAVDGLSEQTIMQLLLEHRRFESALVVSHRRSTLQACSHGIVIEQGRVAESGPLRDLAFYSQMEAEDLETF